MDDSTGTEDFEISDANARKEKAENVKLRAISNKTDHNAQTNTQGANSWDPPTKLL